MATARAPGLAGLPAEEALTMGMLRREIARLLGPSSPSAYLDARLLVAFAAGIPSGDVALHDDRLLPKGAREKAVQLALRRQAGEPVARIVGEKEFWGLPFRLSADTLIPRPDTETIVSAALTALARRRNDELRILDIGTGSGAILLALLSELPRSFGVGTDRSIGALLTARENAARLALAGRAAFAVANWGEPLVPAFDLVVGNPPYIPAREIDALPLEVRAFDPHLSLDGGADGLDAYRAIVPGLARLLRPRGRAFLEVGQEQADLVANLGTGFGFKSDRHRDLAGTERVVEFSRNDAG